MRENNKYLIALSTLAPLIILKGIIILSHTTCIGWDCTAYVEMLDHPAEWDAKYGMPEPLLRLISKPFMSFLPADQIIKGIQFFMHANLAVGTFIFMRKQFGTNTAIIATLLISLFASMNVYMTEIVRNMLAISFLPYAMYYLFNNRSIKHLAIACAFLALMLMAHATSITFIIAAAILLFADYRKHILASIIPISAFAALGFTLFFTSTNQAIGSLPNPTPLENLNLLLLLHLWILIPVFILKFHRNTVMRFLLLSLLPLLGLQFVDFTVAQRLIMEVELPLAYIFAIIFGMLFEGRITVLNNRPTKHLAMATIFFVLMLIVIDAPTSLTFLLTRFGH